MKSAFKKEEKERKNEGVDKLKRRRRKKRRRRRRSGVEARERLKERANEGAKN